MNKDFIKGETVMCDFGLNKGRLFVVTSIVADGYLLHAADENEKDERIYFYNDRTLQKLLMDSEMQRRAEKLKENEGEK